MLRFFVSRLLYVLACIRRDMGNKAVRRREHVAAVRLFSRALKFDPGYGDARLARAVVNFRELGELTAAGRDLDLLANRGLLADRVAYNRAMLRQQQGDFKGAIADLESFLRLSPEHGEDRRSAESALAEFRQLIEESAPDTNGPLE